MSTVVQVQVEQDHLQSLVHPSQPVDAVAELIWNAVDADASTVRVKVIENELGGTDEVHVTDDGHGMSLDDASEEFARLGGSWKRHAGHSRTLNRALHGREGRGRWRAYALGSSVTWTSTAEGDAGLTTITITGNRGALGQFRISAPVPADGQPTGTTVLVENPTVESNALLADSARLRLTAAFATYLEEYPVEIVFRSTRLDPTGLQNHTAEYELDEALESLSLKGVRLRVVEWNQEVDRALYLCDEHGTAIQRLKAGIHAPGFDFTAYLMWEGFREREHELQLAELDAPVLGDLVEVARDELRQHFRSRTGEVTRALIADWKAEDTYPYRSEPSSAVEAAGRDLFDVVAIAAAPAVNRASDISARRLTLGLIREALETSPGSLHRVLGQVLDLSDERLEELDALLDRTPLTAVIATAKRVADRVDFLEGLESLVFDPATKHVLLERKQLHRILAGETWVFGEEFNLMVDDRGLTRALRAHISEMGRDELVSAPVTDEMGRTQIVDLMFGRARLLNTNRREHLVVELKRPSTTLGRDDITQIKGYAFAVVKDERFDTANVDWDFVLVGNDWDEYVEAELDQDDRTQGLIHRGAGIRIWVRSWAQILERNRHRLKFVSDALEYESGQQHARDYLQRTHAKYLPNVESG